MKKRILTIMIAMIMVIAIVPVLVLTVSAAKADDLTVTIDSGAQVTLKDIDSDGFYEIGNANELYAFAALV